MEDRWATIEKSSECSAGAHGMLEHDDNAVRQAYALRVQENCMIPAK